MEEKELANNRTGLEIGVIGMAGRFPGARNIDEFWKNLTAGKNSIRFFSDEELTGAAVAPKLLKNPNYVKASGWLEGIEYFDAAFFGYTPLEAEIMDPQARIFHECVWECFENAGYNPFSFQKITGIYVGAAGNFDWQARVEISGKNKILGKFASRQFNDKDFLATRIAYKLNLKGPAISVNTACSTSLVALHMACQGLLSGDCDMALAGGVAISRLTKAGYLYQEGMLLSPDGFCRPFDARANGTNFGNAAAVVLLKRLDDALQNRDTIHAVIKGSFINNDGSGKAGYTAPDVEGQAKVIRTAIEIAEVAPERIGYVETHGTGTVLGDPMEIEALKLAFKTPKKQFCRIGSVKANVGHLDTAAGITGFIKTVLVLKHRLIPPSLFFETPSPKIDFEKSPFIVNRELIEWKREEFPLTAGVSAFGIGGTNAHVVLEEWPGASEIEGSSIPGEATREVSRPSQSRDFQLILLSARTQSALDKITENLAAHLQQHPGTNLADTAYTLLAGRRLHQYRRMLVCPTYPIDETVKLLSSPGMERIKNLHLDENNPPLIFMFPGLGSQYVNMGRGLYESETEFREEMNRCFRILNSLVDIDIKEVLYPRDWLSNGSEGSEGRGKSPMDTDVAKARGVSIDHIEIAQIVVFIFEYALAKLLIKWGIKPYALMGYSFGEYVAGCISGVFSLEDALMVVVSRGKLIKQLPGGAMLSVPLPVDEIAPYLNPQLALAIDNGPSCIVSGSNAAIEDLEKQMRTKKLMCMPVPSSHALHSNMMEPILEEFTQILDTVSLNEPRIPYISNISGDWITKEQAGAAGYWARHLRQTVRFADGLKVLLKDLNPLFVEIGPGHDISALVQRHIEAQGNGTARVINLVRPSYKKIPDINYLLNKIGILWLYGQPIDENGFYGEEKRYRIPLPSYPFEGKRFWIDSQGLKEKVGTFNQNFQSLQKKDIANWFYIPTWTLYPLLPLDIDHRDERDNRENHGPSRCVIFLYDHCQLGSLLARQLEQADHEVITVKYGTQFVKHSPGVYEIDARQPRDYDKLFRHLGEITQRSFPLRVIHLWGVTEVTGKDHEVPGKEWEAIQKIQDIGFYSLLNLAKAIGKKKIKSPVQVIVITNQMYGVTGQEPLCPAKATLIGAVKVIPQESPGIRCRSVDIVWPPAEPAGETGQSGIDMTLVERLMGEILFDSADTVIAYRGGFRWVQTFQPVQLDNPRQYPSRLRMNGVYLITGGLGKIGRTLAEYLAKKVKAKLILTGRSEVPPRNRWDQWLVEHDDRDAMSTRIKQIKKLEEIGAQVLVFSANVADESQMQTVISRAEQEFGTINGLIHAAGIVRGKTFNAVQKLEKIDCQRQFQPKIKGLLVLEKLLQDRELDFCYLTSSLSAILGGLGFVAYAAANCFMDIFAKKQNRLYVKKRWISVDWEGEEEEEVQTGFERILSLDLVDQVVFSRGGFLQERIKKWIKLESLKETDKEGETTKTSNEQLSRHSRPNLSNPYVPPQTEQEYALVEIWQSLFGFESLGIQDDFIELGGDSLKAVAMINRVYKKLNVAVPLIDFFKNPTIQWLAGYIARGEQDMYHSIPHTEEKEYYLLSPGQRRLYILHQIDPEAVGYNLAVPLLLEDNYDIHLIQQNFHRLIRRHEGLRTSFHMINGEAVQKVHETVDFQLEHYGPPDGVEVGRIISDFIRPFDLSKPPLLRVGLIKEQEDRHIMVVDMHHIIHDGISQVILLREFMALCSGDGEHMPVLTTRYRDYSEWQNFRKKKGTIKKQEEYWTRRFCNEIPVLNLPYDYTRPSMQRYEGNTIGFRIGSKETRALRALALSLDATLFMVLLSIYNIFLSRLSNQEDIVVGTPEAGRKHPDLQSIIGFFLSTLPLRNYPMGHKSFISFIKEVKEGTLEAFENRDFHFEDLVERIRVKRDLSRSPVFDVMFIFHTQWSSRLEENPDTKLKDSTLSTFPYKKQTSEFDLTLIGNEGSNHLVFKFEYCTRLFKKETVERFITYFKTIISAVLDNPAHTINQLEVIPRTEKQRLLYDFNHTAADYPAGKSLQQLFSEQADQVPDRVVLVGSGYWAPGKLEKIHLTYKQLELKSNSLAHILTGKGVTTDTIVGITAERSVELMVGLLGILKAGGAYLPMVPDFPRERLRYMLADSSTKLLVTSASCENPGFAGEIIFLENSDEKIPGESLSSHAKNLAYLIYTSGSTGKPKGVAVRHQNAVNFISGMTAQIDFSPGKTILAVTSISFDIFFLETLLPLTRGMKVVIADDVQQKDPGELGKLIGNSAVNLVQFTPSHLKMLLDYQTELPPLPSVDSLLVGGEAFPPALFEQVKKRFHGNIFNVYGPTETTIWSTVKNLTRVERNQLNIGRPIINTQVYIVDRYHRFQPVQVMGELLIGGDGVAEGYLNNPGLTAEKFIKTEVKIEVKIEDEAAEAHREQIQNKHMSHKSSMYRIYKTGDLARWLDNGEIEFLGRLDFQVKIRGFRIELEEIQHRLLKHDHIKEAVVIARKSSSGESYLAAYIVPRVLSGTQASSPDFPSEAPLSVPALKGYLAMKLPDYMIPAYFIQLESIPLTPSNKIDRKSLPKPGESRPQLEVDYLEPGDEMEEIIARIWQEELGLKKIGVNDNFFDLGGNSINVVKMVNRLRMDFNQQIPVVSVFKYRTVRSFSKYLKQDVESRKILDVEDRSEALVRGNRDRRKRLEIRKGRNQ